jgi:lipopolysaccharide transport system ATP-binding protein
MSEDVVIALKGVSKCFRRYAHPIDRLKEVLLPGKSRAEEFWALHDINLEVAQGKTLGVIGQNGSGKSTLLQIIAGTLTATTGERQVRGRVSALLELGSGFNPEFTGRQNVFFNGQILGLSQAEVAAKFDTIAAFADIGDFIDQPVKTYSSGMFVRLAFAVAINVNPDILIVDEALAVGDGIFVHRCMAKIKDFQDAGGTILFVTHDVGSVTRLCSEAIWLNAGKMVEKGAPADIAKQYQAWIYDNINAARRKEAETQAEAAAIIEENLGSPTLESRSINPFTAKNYHPLTNLSRFGTGRAEIAEFKALNADGTAATFVYPGDVIKLVIKSVVYDAIAQPLVGVIIYDRLRANVTGFNTYQLQITVPKLSAGEILEMSFCFKWPAIQGGNYLLEPAIADGSQDSHEILDWLQCALNIMSGVTDLTFGLIRLPDVEAAYDIHALSPPPRTPA